MRIQRCVGVGIPGRASGSTLYSADVGMCAAAGTDCSKCQVEGCDVCATCQKETW